VGVVVSRVRFADTDETDAYGNEIPGEATTDVIADAWAWPRMSNEQAENGRDGVVVGLTAWIPPGYDLTPDDQVDVNGERYRIDGDAGPAVEYESPFTGWNPGSTVALVRVEG